MNKISILWCKICQVTRFRLLFTLLHSLAQIIINFESSNLTCAVIQWILFVYVVNSATSTKDFLGKFTGATHFVHFTILRRKFSVQNHRVSLLWVWRSFVAAVIIVFNFLLCSLRLLLNQIAIIRRLSSLHQIARNQNWKIKEKINSNEK